MSVAESSPLHPLARVRQAVLGFSHQPPQATRRGIWCSKRASMYQSCGTVSVLHLIKVQTSMAALDLLPIEGRGGKPGPKERLKGSLAEHHPSRPSIVSALYTGPFASQAVISPNPTELLPHHTRILFSIYPDELSGPIKKNSRPSSLGMAY